MRNEHIQEICDEIKFLDGNDPEEMARLKKQLPIITPHACRFRGDGSRKSANAVPSGLVMLDIDHVAEPRRIYAEHIAPVIDRTSGAVDGRSATPEDRPLGGSESSSIAIYFVAITPSGHGLRNSDEINRNA
jgi:hypothetical protein